MSDSSEPQPNDKAASPAQAGGLTPVLEQPSPLSGPARPSERPGGGFLHRFFMLRKEAPLWEVVVFGILCVGLVLGLWWFVTLGEPEERRLSPSVLPSPGETFSTFHGLWFDRALTRNTYASLRRVTLGFGLAAVVGIPLGVLAGCFSWFRAFMAPISIFGRNIPVAALIPLTFSFFGIGEQQKIMFIFIASVAFILSDSARAVMDVDRRYIDTAYTLGARRRQVIMKVLVPLALPDIFNSLRLLFGLAFGYIMLAELVKFGGESGGLGDIINTSQRQGPREHILLVLMIIPLVALAIDRVLFWIQRELFPHRYGGMGLLNSAVQVALHGWESLKGLVFKPSPPPHLRSAFPVTRPPGEEAPG
ncbi:MAG TPA: ABC transporter permease [Phycisphaerae bacterium]|nr:ABC transporter permease [Phycisphaerae bacterium]HOL28149.1 ABC transporter permease [Phycisphaerae bacterium]HPU32540.1 ABC transporter permease [Phycisphaerae bacterium]HXK85489.1 ABC transporter permease [Phycisphaerae bacterium]